MIDNIKPVSVEDLPLDLYAHDLAIAYIMRTSALTQDSTPEEYVKVYKETMGKMANLLAKED